MTFATPLLEADPLVQLHAASAMCSVVLGPVALWRKSRDKWHKAAGYLWILMMVTTAISSFWINDIRLIGPFGPIHLLSLLTLTSLTMGLRYAILRRISAHQRVMKALYFWSLGVAGLFTLLPGRIMGQVVFGSFGQVGFILCALVFAILMLLRTRNDRQTKNKAI